MDQETLFTASKWDILKLLSKSPKSPIQLAKLANTSVANISQQLRLLEMGGIVKSVRISNREKDQPRILYSLAQNHAYVIAIGNKFAEKGFTELDDFSTAILRIMLIPDKKTRYSLQTALWQIEPDFAKIDMVLADVSHAGKPNLHIASESTTAAKKVAGLNAKDVKIHFSSKEDAMKLIDKGIIVLHAKTTQGEVGK
ncbi:MAG: winged helix-turn-helix domain-containing protein [Nanoarchaeota archaeon]|nr:winged helix-turn-helix domain-containing protein [Nanoarchaeota archaeon]